MSEMAVRFWSKVAMADGDGCWEWTAGRDPKGYGQFRSSGRTLRAPRVAYELANGQIPAGQHVCHRCDNPACVRPSHLFIGSHQDNMDDKVAKGRQATGDLTPPETRARGERHGARTMPERRARGSRNGLAKLDEARVLEIRARHAAGERQMSLAREFGISKSQMSSVIRRLTWTHVG